MSRKLIYLVSFVFVPSLVLTSVAEGVDPTLIGWWKFDERSGTTAVDYSGYDRHGRLHGDPQWVAGYDGGALEFDGSGDYVNIDGWKGILGSHAITVSAWVKTTSTATASGSNEIVGWGPNTARQRFSFRINDGRLRTEHQGGNVQGSTNLADGEWHHVGVTVKENSTVSYPEVKLYLDGQDNTIPSTDPDAYNITAAEDVSIGRRPALNDRFFDGLIDEVRIYNRALTQDEIQVIVIMQREEYPFAFGPTPADGALHEDTWVNLGWRAGDFAVSHDVYFGDNFDDVDDGTGGTFQGNQTATSFRVGSARSPYLVPGRTYYWRIDEVNDLHPDSPWKGDVWSFWTPPRTAYGPEPPDGAKYVDPNVVLSWTPGFGAKTHTVYFGDNFDDVNNAAGGLPQRTTIYIPGPLELEKVYYWRVDEDTAGRVKKTHKGDVWSFKTLPEISITDPSLVGWWRFDEGYGTTAIDFSGNGFDIALHNTTWEDGLFEGAVHFHGAGYGHVGNFRYGDNAITVCAWVWHDAFRIDKTERYVTVGPSVAVIRKEADDRLHFYIKTDGNLRHLRVDGFLTEGQWHHVAGTWDGLTQRLYIDGVEIASQALSGVLGDTSHVMISSRDTPFNGMLDEVRIYNRALTQEEIQFLMQGKEWPFALGPTPADGAIHPNTWVSLSWWPGETAASHDVYFGENFDDVNDGTGGTFQGNQTATWFNVGSGRSPYLVPGVTYYWRIDEVEADGATIHKGDIWSFTVPPRTAYEPDPADGTRYVDLDVTLGWEAGFGAILHDVYFGDNSADVDAGTGDTYKGPTVGTTYNPGSLEYNKVYYWRVDEFDGIVTHKGDVWSFKTLPEIDPNLVGWWKFDEGTGNTTIDYSGNGFDITLHNTTWEDGLFEGAVHFHGAGYGHVGNFRYGDNAITVCAWVWHDAFRIDKTERYVTVGPSVAVIRKEADDRLHFYIKTDGNLRHLRVDGFLTEGQWHHVAGTWDGLTQRLYIDGVEIASQAPGGVLGDTSRVRMSSQGEPFNGMLDDVRIYNRALTQDEIQAIVQGEGWPFAFKPEPANGALHPDTWVSLSWSPGFGAKVHDIYLGTDEQAVSDADTSDTTGIYRGRQSVTGYIPPEDLEFGRTYYWRIDEVETDGTTIHKGDLWSFTVVDPLSEALDTALRFTTGGSADWFGQTTTSYHDGDAAQSGDISHNQESWMQTTVSGAGTVKFYWKVSSEEDYDFLEFYIDDSLEDRISGSVNWQQKTYMIGTSASHTLEWRYVKDKDTDFGSDCAWVDKVEWVSN